MKKLWNLTKKSDDILVFIIIAITLWITYFWYSYDFGIHGDDYLRVGRVLGASTEELLEQINFWALESSEGRPLHPLLILLFSYLGFQIGGIQAIYFFAFAILTLNAFLFYLLLKRIFNQPSFTVTGTLSFCLFHADISKIWLTSVIGYHPALSLFLIAAHFYLGKRRALSYFFIFCSLFIQEYSFCLFFAAPLFRKTSFSKLKRNILLNTFTLTGLLFIVFVLRKLLGENRVSELKIFPAVLRGIHNMIFGPVVSLGTYVSRPLETLASLNDEKILLIFLLSCFTGFVWVISRLKFDSLNKELLQRSLFENKLFHLNAPSIFQDYVRVIILGLTLLFLAYPLTLLPTYSVYEITGAKSRIHFVAIVGASILTGAIFSISLFFSNTYSRRRMANVSIACLFSLLVGYGLLVQIDYKDSWQIQRSFWTQVVNICPDIEQGTVILVKPIKNPRYSRPRQFDTYEENTWAYPWVLEQIYKIPRTWKFKPSLYVLEKDWETNIDSLVKSNTDIGGTESIYESIYEILTRSQFLYQGDNRIDGPNLIVLEEKDGVLIRKTQPLKLDGEEFFLKLPPISEDTKLEKKAFYRYLVLPAGEKGVPIS